MEQWRELEGTWEEIAQHAKELAGRRVRLTILSETASPSPSSSRLLLRYVGRWKGPDLEERLREVYETRVPAEF